MSRIIASLVLLILLAGCRYESPHDLRSSMTRHPPTGAFPEGRHVFVTADGKQMLKLAVSAGAARVEHQDGATAPLSATLVEILGSDQLPEKTFVAFAEGSKSESGQKFHYYPFMFNETNIWWLRPSSEVEFSTLSELAGHVAKGFEGNRYLGFERVPPAQQEIMIAHFKGLREKKQAQQNSQQAPAATLQQAVPQQPAPRQVRGFSVGDGVYVQGFLSDETALIQEFDASGKNAKVLRYSDGVSEWVSSDRIISRGQSTANDFGRAAVVGIGIVCLFSPETCKGQQK